MTKVTISDHPFLTTPKRKNIPFSEVIAQLLSNRTAEPEGLCKWELYHEEAYWWLPGLQQAHTAFPERS